jgi:hypothetical protein
LTELKGVDVPKSLKQLSGTLNMFKNFFDGFDHVYARAVVTSSTPDLKASPDYVKLATKQYHGNIKINERQMTEKDIDL